MEKRLPPGRLASVRGSLGVRLRFAVGGSGRSTGGGGGICAARRVSARDARATASRGGGARLAALLARRVFAAHPADAERHVAHALVGQRGSHLDVPRQRAYLLRRVALQRRLRCASRARRVSALARGTTEKRVSGRGCCGAGARRGAAPLGWPALLCSTPRCTSSCRTPCPRGPPPAPAGAAQGHVGGGARCVRAPHALMLPSHARLYAGPSDLASTKVGRPTAGPFLR